MSNLRHQERRPTFWYMTKDAQACVPKEVALRESTSWLRTRTVRQ
jgi:hypothetical protein